MISMLSIKPIRSWCCYVVNKTKEIGRAPEYYKERISNLLKLAKRNNVDVVFFPAFTFLVQENIGSIAWNKGPYGPIPILLNGGQPAVACISTSTKNISNCPYIFAPAAVLAKEKERPLPIFVSAHCCYRGQSVKTFETALDALKDFNSRNFMGVTFWVHSHSNLDGDWAWGFNTSEKPQEVGDARDIFQIFRLE